jgi:adenine-specific DNA-methyltransferase
VSRTPIQIETSRLALLGELDQQKSASQRNRWGQFATPPPLADQIVRTALKLLPKEGKIRYLEPGFGTGSFLSALRLATSRLGFAKAIELDPLFADHARNLWKGTGLRIVEGDFTELSPPSSESAKFDLVVSNPPYVRHHHIDRGKKKSLQSLIADRMGIQISGLAGLYAHFMLLSQPWMKQGGIGAWLVPAEFMDVNYGDAIRAFLVDRVTLSRIHRFDPSEVQFDDALVSSVAVFFKNERPPLGHKFSLQPAVPCNARERIGDCPLRRWQNPANGPLSPKRMSGDGREPCCPTCLRSSAGLPLDATVSLC